MVVKHYQTRNAVYSVNAAEKKVRRVPTSTHHLWIDDTWLYYEFITHQDGRLYIQAIHPDNGTILPIRTSTIQPDN